ncbi:TPR-like protein [Tuber magnatum]|uniref:TPR-like protein n=1 Tax=Tuber magnatum TaxID=42249 RepID=A0A317SQ40_9PEZI|nr:TPR-like protein [Tuber magnatum]
MAKKDYPSAIEYYTQALRIVPNNSIYLSNRAAAYSSISQYEKAILDAQVAVDTDPSYAKAWSRLGHARFAKGDARGAMEAYKAGIEAEGNGGSQITRNGYETAKKKVEEEIAAEADNIAAPSGPSASRGLGVGGMPDLSSLAGMLGGAGGRGGGGMPDLNSIMSNPMVAQMAQNFMSNPSAMQEMMNNPLLREMMDSVGGDDGEGAGTGGRSMPDLGSLLADPSIAEMAKNLMGGASGGDAGGAGGSGHT